MHVILLTLVRKSELLLAKWRNVDLKNGQWEVPAENSKTGNPHIVYMSRQVVEMFKELKELAGDSEWVLPGRGSLKKPFAQNALNQALEGVNFPIDPFTIHDLRPTGSTRLHEQGYSSDVVEKALNVQPNPNGGWDNKKAGAGRAVIAPAARCWHFVPLIYVQERC